MGSSLQWTLRCNMEFRNLPIVRDPEEWRGNCQPHELRWLMGQREGQAQSLHGCFRGLLGLTPARPQAGGYGTG